MRLTGRDDVVFGAVVAGRPPELPGVETMLGLFINTVPVRVRLDPQLTAEQLWARLQDQQSALLAYHYLGLAQIQRAAGPGAVFDTLVVYENYPRDPAGLAGAAPWPGPGPGHRCGRAQRCALPADADRAAGSPAAAAADLPPGRVQRGGGGADRGAAGAGAGAGGRRPGGAGASGVAAV